MPVEKTPSSRMPLMNSEEHDERLSRILFRVVLLITGSYLCLYGLIPKAYSIGPGVLFLLSLVTLSLADLRRGGGLSSPWVPAALCLYGLSHWLVLAVHGEDLSEFDLPSRYLAASAVLIFVSKYPPPGRAVFAYCGVGAILSGIFALYQVGAGQVSRVESFDNAIHFGNGSMALAVISLCGLTAGLEKKLPNWLTLILVLGFVLGMYAALASGSRGVWLAFPILIIVMMALFWGRMPGRKKLVGAAVVTAVLGASTFLQFEKVESRVAVGIGEYSGYFDSGKNGTSVGLRLDMWKAGLIAFESSPLVGVGPAGLDRLLGQLVEDQIIHPTTATFRHLHNQFIDILARQGLVGIMFYALLIGSILSSFKRLFINSQLSATGHALAAAGIVFVTQHLIVNLTLSTLERSIGTMMFVFMVVFLLASSSGEKKNEFGR